MKPITIIEGSAASPVGEGKKIIVHIFRSGDLKPILRELSNRWPRVESQLRSWLNGNLFVAGRRMTKGQVLFVECERGHFVAHLFAATDAEAGFDLEALRVGMSVIAFRAELTGASLHIDASQIPSETIAEILAADLATSDSTVASTFYRPAANN